MGKNEFIRDLIGKEYLMRKAGVEELTPFVYDAFREIAAVNKELFDLIPYEVIFTNEDVYINAKEMREHVAATNKIYIYTGWSGHPYLTQEENNIGRAVHDVFAHMVCGCPFNFEGEYTAYLEQRKYYPEWTWDVLFAEIPAQTAAYYANNYSHDFEQRAIAAPQRWRLLGDMLDLPDYSHNSVLSPVSFNYKLQGVK